MTQAGLLGVSRRSLYYQPVPPPPEELTIKQRIDELYTAHPFYGSRKLMVLLSEDFGPINRKRVQRYMREMGIAGISPGPNLSKRAAQHRVYPFCCAVSLPDSQSDLGERTSSTASNIHCSRSNRQRAAYVLIRVEVIPIVTDSITLVKADEAFDTTFQYTPDRRIKLYRFVRIVYDDQSIDLPVDLGTF